MTKHPFPDQKVPVGTPVWFLSLGGETDKPLPATIISMSDNLVCRLSYIDPDGVHGHRLTCHPLGHPMLKDDKGAPTESARRNGAWTYNPMFVPQPDKSKEPVESAPKKKPVAKKD